MHRARQPLFPAQPEKLFYIRDHIGCPAHSRLVWGSVMPDESPASTGEGPHWSHLLGDELPERTAVIHGPDWRSDRIAQGVVDTPGPAPTPSPTLGHYVLLEPLGAGGFGLVYKAFDQKLQRIVAIKKMAPDLAANSPARKRFVREARAGAAVQHENVVRIYAVEEQPTPYLVMEYVDGGSLQQHLNDTGPLDPAETLRIGAQIARGLAAAHAQGLIHRDVKPGNVMLEGSERPRVKLTDFGLARAADDASLTQSGMVVGTPLYMAPEQARGEKIDHRADLFSLGSVLYTMVTGRPPFRAANTLAVLKRVAEETPRPIKEIIPETPNWLCAIIDRLHAANPADRYSTANEAAEVLESCLHELNTGDSSKLHRIVKKRRPGVWIGAGVCVTLAALTLILGLSKTAISSSEPTPTPNPTPTPAATAPVAASVPTPAVPETFTNAAGIEFVRIPAGSAPYGGSPTNEPTHTAVIPQDMYISKYEVTRDEWAHVLYPGQNTLWIYTKNLPTAALDKFSEAQLHRLPVEGVSWDQCQQFIQALNKMANETGWVYRMPTTFEWEYVCRNGSGQPDEDYRKLHYMGREASNEFNASLGNVAASGYGHVMPVGSYPPNRLGVYDMQGNVAEYLDDTFGEQRELRPLAGGSFADSGDTLEARTRVFALPPNFTRHAGLRLVRVPVAQHYTPRMKVDQFYSEFKAQNPEFNGKINVTFEGHRLVKLHFADYTANSIRDLTSFRWLTDLRSIEAWNTAVSDLSPLQGLPLKHLNLNNCWTISSLAPLKGMQLESLELWGFNGTDLSPLKGMPISLLCVGGCWWNKVDLSPLKGMPLRILVLNCMDIEDLSPLADAPLEELLVAETKVRDLSPISDKRLTKLIAGLLPNLTDREQLRRFKNVTVLSADLDPKKEADQELLKSLPKLKVFKDKPVEEFFAAGEKK